MTVAIIGGGVVGLTGAIALREAGLKATVYDRVDDVAAAQIGAGLGLAFNATRVLRRLGLLDGLAQVGSRLERFEFRSWKGKLLSSWGVPEGEDQFGVTRKSLHELLVRALPADAIVCGKTCTGYEQDDSSVTALFADGTSGQSDVLVGADGLRSTIRAQALGEEPPRYADFSVTRCLVPADGDDPLPRGVFRMLLGARRVHRHVPRRPGSRLRVRLVAERGGRPRRRTAPGRMRCASAMPTGRRRFPS